MTPEALGRGERIWVLAMVNEPISVKGVEKVEKYLLLSNCRHGRTSLLVRFTQIRAVCQNTLSAALSKAKLQSRASRHRRSIPLPGAD
jgi:hypothetical protein